jgi:predicted TIM-barrel fold metal-dependent hydrolase
MSTATEKQLGPPEYNMTGHDYSMRSHLRYTGAIIDVHAHVMQTQPSDPKDGPPPGPGPLSTSDQAAELLDVAAEFQIERIFSMCPVDDISALRARFGNRLAFSGPISKKLEESEDVAYRLLDRFLEAGVVMLKFWSAPRGRDRGLFVDAPWRIEAARRGRAAGIRAIMVHVADPDLWFGSQYADQAKFGSKPQQYAGLERMLQEFPDLTWIAAHMGGDPEHPDHLEAMLEKYPNLHFDTSATKWQVREVSPRREAIRSLICRHPDRFLFGSDQVTRHALVREHYLSRYWCQRTLWESDWNGPSPIADPDSAAGGGPSTPQLHGLGLPEEVLEKLYRGNVLRLFPRLPAC